MTQPKYIVTEEVVRELVAALEPFAKAADNVAPDDGSIGGCLCAPILLRSEIFAARDAITKASAVNPRDEGAPTI